MHPDIRAGARPESYGISGEAARIVLFRIVFSRNPLARLVANRTAGLTCRLTGASAFSASRNFALRGTGYRFNLIHDNSISSVLLLFSY